MTIIICDRKESSKTCHYEIIIYTYSDIYIYILLSCYYKSIMLIANRNHGAIDLISIKSLAHYFPKWKITGATDVSKVSCLHLSLILT